MLLIPAIDLKNGSCVRLRQGDFTNVTIFSENPVSIAEKWFDQGARRLHLVDLDGALSGKPEHDIQIKKILKKISKKVDVQVGGGVRDLKTIESYLKSGASYVVVGTAAITNPSFLQEACINFPGQIIVALDTRDGMIATDGWSKNTGYSMMDISKEIENYGCASFIYTDINRDGMLSGINLKQASLLADNVRIPIYISGGIVNIQDIKTLCLLKSEKIKGAILGRSLYQGTLDFKQAQDFVWNFIKSNNSGDV
ncbi:MAG: 1-(5-phosphoribosyl)-5-[(5-phosphoribosylamino)methylideneamino]imidazole-4-carboxamide isomerase [Bordetella sp.]|nr:MAG: 1-(5-phosphoribosyl)-5-[(5-phosphoribosylamino)methylideneamino]imidazole-4-carboxamide isomerase [Bordetella sp.]